MKHPMQMDVNDLLVQISVVVAAIQTSYDMCKCMQKQTLYVDIALKAVVEKVSLRVALMQGLVGPKGLVKTSRHNNSKGNQVNIPELE
jgi:hypothetical protein